MFLHWSVHSWLQRIQQVYAALRSFVVFRPLMTDVPTKDFNYDERDCVHYIIVLMAHKAPETARFFFLRTS